MDATERLDPDYGRISLDCQDGSIRLVIQAGLHLHVWTSQHPSLCACQHGVAQLVDGGCVPALIDAMLPLLADADQRRMSELRANAVPREEE